nr:hypothetical protein CFP56_21434 [Quercus suber]
MCHFKLRAITSSLPSDQYFISSERSKAYPELPMARPLSPFLQVCMKEFEGRDMSPSLKELHQPKDERVVDKATSTPVMAGRSKALSLKIVPRVGGGFKIAMT